MAMTLRLTEKEQQDLKDLASDQGVSMQDLARQAIREYIIRSEHRAQVGRAADLIMSVHAEAIDLLGK
jgi:predicted transcriptional regulator